MMLGPIQDHLKEKYDNLKIMTESEMDQLSWNAISKTTTSEGDVIVKVPPHVEVVRCTSRLYNLELLRQGKITHLDFIAAQPKDKPYSPPLSESDYEILTQRFEGYDELKHETLRVATVISSVYSEKAKQEANRVLGVGKWSEDSVEFFADAFKDIEKAKQMFPLVNKLFEKYKNPADQKRIQAYLQTAFSHATHYRHMLYTEGSSKMFRQFLTDFKAGKITRDTFNFLISYWTINIAGFRAQMDKLVKGSSYLTANTFKGMRALEKQLERVFTEPDVTEAQILEAYLDERAAFLQLDALEERGEVLKGVTFAPEEKRFLAHVGAMMRLYTPEEGGVLALGYKRIPDAYKANYAKLYFNYDLATPTYGPAVFQNGINYREDVYNAMIVPGVTHENYTKDVVGHATYTKRLLAIADITVGFLPLYLDVVQRHQDDYQEKVAKNETPSSLPLNFNAIAFEDSIVQFCASSPILEPYDIFEELSFKFDDKGKVTVVDLENFKLNAMAAKAKVASKAAMAANSAVNDAAEAVLKLTKQANRRPMPSFDLAKEQNNKTDPLGASASASASASAGSTSSTVTETKRISSVFQ